MEALLILNNAITASDSCSHISDWSMQENTSNEPNSIANDRKCAQIEECLIKNGIQLFLMRFQCYLRHVVVSFQDII